MDREQSTREVKLLRLLKKGNVMLEGPPGTGKTTLIYRIFGRAKGVEERTTLIVTMTDVSWTARDLIGGSYLRDMSEVWRSGFLLRALSEALEKPVLLLIDEVNRCDVDKVFGPFFSIFVSPRAGEWRFEALKSYLEEQKKKFGVLDESAERVLNYLERDPQGEKFKKYLRIVITFNTVDYATTFQMGEAFRRRFYPLLVRNTFDEVKELIDESPLDEKEKKIVERFLKRLHEEAGYHDPLPIYIGHVKLFLDLYDALGFDDAFCSAFVNPALELDYENCEKVKKVLEEVWGSSPPCRLRCSA